jgi:hypothetical protein
MAMTDRERILAYLRSLSPKAATNSEILEATGIESHHDVYELTQALMLEREIHGVKGERGWVFWLGEPEALPEPIRARRRRRGLGPSRFEALAREKMGEHFHIQLERGYVGQVHKEFDFVAPYARIVGDAIHFRGPTGTRWAPAKAALVAERVWMLEKTGAPLTFLVFGNDRHAPTMWLERFGNLVFNVSFYFLSDDGELEELPNPGAAGAATKTWEPEESTGSPESP